MNRPIVSIMTLCVCVLSAAVSARAIARQTKPEEYGPQPPQADSPVQAAPPVDGAKFPWPETPAARPNAGATTAPAALNGTIAIRAVQGTPGGKAIGVVPVEVEIQHRGATVNTITTKTDEHGIVMLENLPVSMGIQPVVRVQYADLFYQVEGGLMDAEHSQQQIDVVCYEPTEEPPPWKVQMRHVMIAASPADKGLAVTEVIVIENPADRTWIGLPVKDRRVTTAFALPAGASKVTLGQGFHDWSTSTLADGHLINHLPLMPESTQMVYSYLVPVSGGWATIDIEAPAAVEAMMVLVPESLAAKSFSGMQLGGTEKMGERTVRYYTASNLHAGDRASITLTGLSVDSGGASGGGEGVAAKGGAAGTAKIIAGVGAGVILLVGIGVIMLKSGKSAKPATRPAQVH